MKTNVAFPPVFLSILFLFAAASAVHSQAPFFQGKTIKIINNDPGGTAGLRVKVVMTHLRKYIPGSPTLNSFSWMVEIGRLRAKRKSVMPATAGIPFSCVLQRW